MSIRNRKIIEALRTGVPTQDAVALLGSGQPALDKRFIELLSETQRGSNEHNRGFVFFGDFGTGKSHVLESFAIEALTKNFVVSRATISQSLKLGTRYAILPALVNNTVTPDHHDNGLMRMIADACEARQDFSALQKWTREEVTAGRLDSIFESIADVLPSLYYGSETFELVFDYFLGANVVGSLKLVLKNRTSNMTRIEERLPQTVAFINRVILSIGYSGWILLFDELELIRLIGGKITKGNSYAELAKWLNLDQSRPARGLGVVGCMTSGYVESQIKWTVNGPKEFDTIPPAMKSSKTLSTRESTGAVEACFDFLIGCSGEEALKVQHQTSTNLTQVQDVVRSVYDACYGVVASPIPVRADGIESMRIQIRRWITTWDLERIDQAVDLTENFVEQNFTEVSDEEDEEEDE